MAGRARLGAAINWFPGHMAEATRQMRERLKAVDLAVEVRDARIPLSSANEQLDEMLRHKRRLIVLNKRDLANRNLEQKWSSFFTEKKQTHVFASTIHPGSVLKVMKIAQDWLSRERGKDPLLVIMVVGMPNVGKSALINAMHRQGLPHLAAQGEAKTAKVGPLPGVTRHLAGFRIADKPCTYVLDTPGVMVPNVKDVEVGLKLALTGAVKDSVVGEDRLARFLLTTLNARQRSTYERSTGFGEVPVSDKDQKTSMADYVAEAMALPWENPESDECPEDGMEVRVEKQMQFLRKCLRIPHDKGDDGQTVLSRRLLQLYRTGALGRFTLDRVPLVDHSDSGG